MIDASFLDQLSKFHLIINKRVTSNYIGQKKSSAAGRGLTFKDYRIYAPGDDIRLIDWKVYARTDHLYIKSYEEERNMTVHVLSDCSASMNFGKPISKWDYASMLAVGYAYLGMRDNEKVQFATFSDTLEIFQPKRGPAHLLSMISHLNSIKPKGQSQMRNALLEYRKVIGTKALVVVISDFLLPYNDIKESLYQLSGNEVKVIQVLDKVEKELKMEGDYKLTDSETRGIFRTFISPRMRSQYQQQLDAHCAQIEQTCNQLGFEYYLATSDVPIFETFYKMLNQ